MITKITDIFNGFQNKFKEITKEDLTAEIIQDIYDSIVKDASIILTCPNPLCGGNHSFICWGYYTRTLIVLGIVVSLRVKRLRCKECGRTHGVHIVSMVGYRQISMESIIDILTSSSTAEVEGPFEESYIYKIKSLYKSKWKARLIPLGIKDLNININDLSKQVLNKYNLQFMQIHCGNNYLFQSPT